MPRVQGRVQQRNGPVSGFALAARLPPLGRTARRSGRIPPAAADRACSKKRPQDTRCKAAFRMPKELLHLENGQILIIISDLSIG